MLKREKGINMIKQSIMENIPHEDVDRHLLALGLQGDPEDKRFVFADKDGTPARTGIMAALKKVYEESWETDERFIHFGTWDFIKILGLIENSTKGPLGLYEWLEWYDIWSKKIKADANAVAAVIMQDDLIKQDEPGETFKLKTKNYGECFNLSDHDSFYKQPIASGQMGSGFLVKEDVMVTTGPLVTEENLPNLCFVFGYRMNDENKACKTIAVEDIFKGIKIIDKAENGGNWVLVQLDRKVENRAPVKLANKDVEVGQSVHVVGHPLGLPLKYISGPQVLETIDDHQFTANLGMYGAGCGSPIFDLKTHEVLGIVEYMNHPGLRWTGKHWLSITNVSTTGSEAVTCTRIMSHLL
jgi:Trypsin-like peptidase domain